MLKYIHFFMWASGTNKLTTVWISSTYKSVAFQIWQLHCVSSTISTIICACIIIYHIFHHIRIYFVMTLRQFTWLPECLWNNPARNWKDWLVHSYSKAELMGRICAMYCIYEMSRIWYKIKLFYCGLFSIVSNHALTFYSFTYIGICANCLSEVHISAL